MDVERNAGQTKFTVIYFEGHDGWIVGYVRELSGALAQGRDLSDLWQNLRDARELVLQQIVRQNEENFREMRELGRADLDVPPPSMSAVKPIERRR